MKKNKDINNDKQYKSAEITRKRATAYYHNNKEKILLKKKEFYKNNRERLLEEMKLRYNPDAKSEYDEEHYIKNREWRKKRSNVYYHKNRGKVKNSILLKNYKISLEDYKQKLKEQGDCCAICKRPYDASKLFSEKALAVDHDHTTGQVRGLLCETCNRAVGMFNDDVRIFTNAIEYLNKWKLL